MITLDFLCNWMNVEVETLVCVRLVVCPRPAVLCSALQQVQTPTLCVLRTTTKQALLWDRHAVVLVNLYLGSKCKDSKSSEVILL